MRFFQPQMFNLFWAVILFCLFLVWTMIRHKKIMQKMIQAHLLPSVSASFSARRLLFKKVILIFVLLFCVIALARPQWGFQWMEVKQQGLDILVVIDTSKSMLTQDVKPNRLERTKLAVKDLLRKLKGDRIGLIAFAGDAFMVCPLTVDYGGFMLSLNELSVDSVSRGGTNIPRAIEEAMRGYEKVPSQYKAIIVITDGDNLEGDPVAAANKAKKKGIKIYCVGIGSKEGELIQYTNEFGQKEFVKDLDGNFVKSRLNEKILQQIALTTGGIYVKSSGAQFGLDLIYDNDLSTLEKRDIESKMEKRFYERFQIPLVIALILLVIETWLSTRKKYNHLKEE